MDDDVKKQVDELVELNKQLLERVEAAEAKAKASEGLEKKLAGLAKAAAGEMCELEGGGEGVYDENGECVAKVDKAAVPDEIKKQMDAQAEEIKKAKERADASDARIAKMEDEKVAKAYVERASEYKHLPIKPDEFGPVLRKAEAGMDDVSKAELHRVLKAGNAAMQAAMGEKGAGGSADVDSAYAKMEAQADEIRKTDKKLTREQAFAKAMSDHPELAQQVRKEEERAH